MIVRCEKCQHIYDDENRWTICPHAPLWAKWDAYCREHDLVNCKLHDDPKRRIPLKEVLLVAATAVACAIAVGCTVSFFLMR